MVKIYVKRITVDKDFTLEDVPVRYREQVAAALAVHLADEPVEEHPLTQ